MTIEKKAVVTASLTAFFLTIFKFIVAFITGSAVILASAIDSILDMGISLFNVYAVRTAEKQENDMYNYGKGKIEGLASVIEGVIISFSAIFIIYQGVTNIVTEKKVESFDLAFLVMILSTLTTFFLVMYLNKVGKKTNSLVIKADALHYKTDLFTNIGIIISLALVYVTNFHPIDGIVAIIIALYIFKEAISIIKEGTEMLMDRALDEETIFEIEKALDEAKITSYHFLKTRRSGTTNFVDVHLVFTRDILLFDAHEISDALEARIREIDNKSKWIINPHFDPYDDSKREG